VVDAAWQAVAALVDPVRRALYEYVRRGRRPITREEAAQAVDISRNLAAFHLDKLVEAGLLAARYEALGGQPRGRGRTPKVYEARGEGLALTVPGRRYDLVSTILADAITASPRNAQTEAHVCATKLGADLGAAATPGRSPHTEAATVALAELGYEPQRAGDDIVLGNCPFHAVALRHTALICGINVAFVGGLLAGLGCDHLRAELRPRAGGCCACIRPR
jgi:predicted ArsR family transcriptional regulator